MKITEDNLPLIRFMWTYIRHHRRDLLSELSLFKNGENLSDVISLVEKSFDKKMLSFKNSLKSTYGVDDKEIDELFHSFELNFILNQNKITV